MGVFDYCCSATGLSLRGEKAVCVWLCEVEPGRWVPAALPIRGSYDRYGRVDYVESNFNTRLLAKWFYVGVEGGKFQLKGDAAWTWENAGKTTSITIDRAIAAVERGTTMKIGDVKFLGKPIAQALFQQTIYDAAVSACEATIDATVASVLPCEVGGWLYQQIPSDERTGAMGAFDELARFASWFKDWKPGTVDGQHQDIDTARMYLAARERFADVEWMKEALEEAAEASEVGGDLPLRWIRDFGKSWYGFRRDSTEIAATSRVALEAVIADELSTYDASDLLEQPIEAFAVVRGVGQAPIDLHRAISFRGGNATAQLTNRDAIEELVTTPGIEVEMQIDFSVLDQLGVLEGPLAAMENEPICERDGRLIAFGSFER